MSKQNHNQQTTRHESLADLDLVSLWSPNGSDWTEIVKEEIQAATNQQIEAQTNLIDKLVLLEVLATLGLLLAALWVQTPQIYQAVQEAGTNSAKELISSY